MREETLEGTLVRKRPLSKRLVFLSILESDELPIVTVVIKEECGGVGGAAEARSALKLGDRLRVCGAYESAESTRSDEKVLRATHVQVTLPWRVVGGGAAWQHNARDSQPSAVPPKPPEQKPPGDPSDAQASDLPVCHSWLNTGRCPRPDCGLRHWSADLKAERVAWVANRRASRMQLAASAGDPTDPHDKASNTRRAEIFSEWLCTSFGSRALAANAGVLDVAGGRGALSYLSLIHI